MNGQWVARLCTLGHNGARSLALLGSLTYLGGEEVVSGFAAGYPQHLRIVLGVIVKPLAAIIILLPGLALLKEWAYVGAGITWVMATIAHYSSGEVPGVGRPLTLLVLLIVSAATRPANRRLALGAPALTV